MNCREAQTQIFAERDSALGDPERAALVAHVAACGACRRVREDLTTTLAYWKTTAQAVVVPDAEREWHAVRRKIRGGVEAGEVRLTPRRPGWLTWLTVPLAAAGALALALYVSMPTGNPTNPGVRPSTAPVARADSVEVGGRNASTMVFLDDKSGWLIVQASDVTPKQG
jgi:hypothetical protein